MRDSFLCRWESGARSRYRQRILFTKHDLCKSGKEMGRNQFFVSIVDMVK